MLFWSDVWNDNLLQHNIPRLFSFAKNKNILVAAFLQNTSLENQFHLPLSEQPFQEYHQLQQIIQQTQVSENSKDSWNYIWGSFTCSASKFYHLPYNNITPRPYVWIWDSKCANNIKVFTWLLLMDRLNVRNILRRKRHKLQDNNYNCVICSCHYEETTFQLFFSCSFRARCWQHLGITWRFDLQFHAMMEEANQSFSSAFFMEFFIIGAWQIWKERNNLIFSRATLPSGHGRLGF
jgi:hypothetical protein